MVRVYVPAVCEGTLMTNVVEVKEEMVMVPVPVKVTDMLEPKLVPVMVKRFTWPDGAPVGVMSELTVMGLK